MHDDDKYVMGRGMWLHTQALAVHDAFALAPGSSISPPSPSPPTNDVLRPVSRPFAPEGGLRMLGKPRRGGGQVPAVARTSSHYRAGCRSSRYAAVLAAFNSNHFDQHCVVNVRFQGHRLVACRSCTSASQPRCCSIAGIRVALVTDGRMSGASGRSAAIHVTPEAASWRRTCAGA